ncbi:gamma-glutamylcyclotransferase [Marinivivus vitaminiproducens]|uniref:gamma-glutamylcyclotransferase n=1 Tax=Marinivivus vitaminiproducens TaxID=3035935 RepID=UPI0027A67687|nr:gamma-glutamylcyclotransferase [Geminicoccaceae bacterium SCSIO 64248]
MTLTRDSLRSGLLLEMIRNQAGPNRALSDEEMLASRQAALRARPDEGDIWVFGYGSLIWNPALEYVERRVGRLQGYHRTFCLWTHMGRGTRERPGLVLGLEAGGECQGVLFRIAEAAIDEETHLLWRREMVTNAYEPRWLEVSSALGVVNALSFVMNTRHERYAGELSDEQVAAVIATAEGNLGRCADYFYNTVAHLDEMGLEDAFLRRLRAQVAALETCIAQEGSCAVSS